MVKQQEDVPSGESVLLCKTSVWIGERVQYAVAYHFGLSVCNLIDVACLDNSVYSVYTWSIQ